MPSDPDGAGPLATVLATYLDNLQALYAIDPELAARIDAIPFSSLPQLEQARDGNCTLQQAADDGAPIYLHSRYRPLEEAKTLIDSQIRTATDSEPLDPDVGNQCFLVLGLGLGYHVAEIERRFFRPILIIAEDDLALIKTALCVTSLVHSMQDRRLTFLTSIDKSQVHARLRPAMATLLLGLCFITPAYARRRGLAFQNQVTALVRDFIQYARLQMVSLARNARITCRNALFNLPAYVGRPGIDALENLASGYPAVVIAAGPSLAYNLDRLAELQSRAVLIAVPTAFKLLLGLGIRPHFVACLDYHEISAQFFRGIDDPGDTVLVAEPKVAWQVVDAFRGRLHLLYNSIYDDLLGTSAPRRAGLKAGSTVAHLAFYLAEYLGCEPIVLVGQDLSFTDGLYYPPGMPIERVWAPELSRFQTIEMRQWERIVRGRGGLRVVRDVLGRDVFTDDQLFTYAEQFQADILGSRTRVIQAAEGGMRLAGAEVLPLAQVIERYCTRTLPNLAAADSAAVAAPGGLSNGTAESPLSSARVALATRESELRALGSLCRQTLDLLERLGQALDQPATFNRLVAQLDELRTQAHSSAHAFQLVSQAAQAAELRRLQADRGIRDDIAETPAAARRRLARDRAYVSEILDGCSFVLGLFPEMLARLEADQARCGGAS